MAAPFDKRKSLQSALAYTQQGKWDRAIAEYQTILKADPRDLTVCNNLGDLYARAGKSGEAIEQYLKLGELYRTDGLSVKAIAVYKKIAKLDATHTGAYQACAELYWEQGLVGEAKIQMATVVEQYAKAGNTAKLIEAYQKLIQYDPGNIQVIARLADVLLNDGRRDEAAAEYDRAAQAAQAVGQAADSKRFFAKARELAPAALEANVGMAEVLVGEGKLADAEAMLTTITEADSGNGTAWRLLGEVQRSLGNAEQAVHSLRQAVSLGVSELEVARPLGAGLLALGQADDAVALCRRLMDEVLVSGDPDQVVAVVRDLVAEAPGSIPMHLELATNLMNLGRDAEAQAALWGLANAHEAAGDAEGAAGVFRQILYRDPEDTEAQSRLESLAGGAAAAPGDAGADRASEAVPELVLEVPEELPAALPGDPMSPRVEAAPDEAAALSLSTLDELELPPPPNAPMAAEPAVEPAAVEDPFSAYRDLGLATEEEANRLLFDEPSEGVDDASADLPLTLESEPATQAVPPAAAGGGWISEEIPTLELEDIAAEGAPPLDIAAPVTEPAAEPAPLADLGGDESLGALGYSVDALSRRLSPEVVGPGLGAVEDGDGDDEVGTRIAEQLAEAEVYLKYGLEEKARERLLDAVRQEPEAVVAHRRLKALYLQRRQPADAVVEMVTMARILAGRGRAEAAELEIQEARVLLPEHPDLLAYAPDAAPGDVPGGLEPEPLPEALPVPVQAAEEPPIPFIMEEPSALVVEEAAVPLVPLEALGESAMITEEPPTAVGAEEPSVLEAEPPPMPSVVAAPPDEAPVAPDETPVALSLEEPAPEIPLPPADEAPGAAAPTPVGEVEEMPAELRALLEEAAEPPIEILSAGLDDEPLLVDDLAEAEFYLAQGMIEEAQGVYERMRARHAEHPAVAQLGQRLGQAAQQPREAADELPSATVQQLQQSAPEPPLPEAPAPPEPPVEPLVEPPAPEEERPKFTVTDTTAEPAAGPFVDLGAELEQELAADEQPAPAHAGPTPLVDGLLHEFQKGVREQLDEKDFETHYNLGIAYKEMELFDEAIQEFRLTSRDPGRILECADLMGLCYLAKGQPDQAVRSLLAGLEIEGHPPEAYHSLHYDLGVAYEAMGEVEKSLAQFELLQQQGARFRDVQVRVQGLRARLPKGKEPPPDGAKPPRKKKISFI